jgi:protein-S-isoprenylcysteine O-methyltransferase Ste14
MRRHWLVGWSINGLGMLAIVGSWTLLATLGPRWDEPSLSWAGGLAGAAGACLFVASARRVGRLRRPSRYSFDLDTSGPYAFVRHPQALALSLLVAGLAGLSRSAPLLATLPLWTAGWYLYARLEEALELLPSFGRRYLDYARETPRFLPEPRRILELFHQASEESTFSSR